MTQADFLLAHDNKYYSLLEIDSFTKMLKDPSTCYKFYWLEAIVSLINANITETTIGDVIDEMIANAWYSVVEYHIHLSGYVRGDVVDGLERSVIRLKELSNLENTSSKSDIKSAISEHSKDMNRVKVQLINEVPYRVFAGFFDNHNVRVNWNRKTDLINLISTFDQTSTRLPYTFGTGSSLNRRIIFNPDWIKMINDNTVEILGWIQYEKVKWLQNNNPEVPGLVYKLKPGDNERKLGKVRALWDGVLSCSDIRDIYTRSPINPNDYDMDHFVPWSFVMNDELWNLLPMDSSLNSSKSNNLPDWDRFFRDFAKNQYIMYSLVRKNDHIHSLFDKCYKDNLHSIWAQQDLYISTTDEERFTKILTKNMQPVYDSALRQGYSVWNYSKETI